RVSRVEGELPAHSRYPDAIPVAADAAHDAIDEPPRAPIVGPAELERVEQRNRPSAHGDDVAQDASHPGCRALVRLDSTRVVMRLDFEGHSQPIADAHDARVFAGAGKHVTAGAGQRAQERLAALIRAMLAPHNAEHGQLEIVRRAPQELLDLLELEL